jgi:hypothetical protein
MGEEDELRHRQPWSRRSEYRSDAAGVAGSSEKHHGVGDADYFPPSFAKEKLDIPPAIITDDVDEAHLSASTDAVHTITGDDLEEQKKPPTTRRRRRDKSKT